MVYEDKNLIISTPIQQEYFQSPNGCIYGGNTLLFSEKNVVLLLYNDRHHHPGKNGVSHRERRMIPTSMRYFLIVHVNRV